MERSGSALLHDVAVRILARWLEETGRQEVHALGASRRPRTSGPDITYAWQGGRRRITVKPDPYFGTDPALVADRSLSFYRADARAYGLEAIADAATREPGWALEADADDIYYYFLAIAQPEAEVAALFSEPDGVFFSELRVASDDLVILPARALSEWFAANADRYPARPVVGGDGASWYRMVPRADLETGVHGIVHPGPLFHSLRVRRAV